MNFEVGSAAAYREIFISAMGAIPRPVEQYIPERGLMLMRMFPPIPFSANSLDGTGWRSFGRIRRDLEDYVALPFVIDNLFRILTSNGYQIDCQEEIKLSLMNNERVYLFVRRNMILREMIVLYPVALSRILFSRTEKYVSNNLLYPNVELNFFLDYLEI